MPLIYCRACGKEVSDQALSCPHCGQPIAAAGPPLVAQPPRTFVKVAKGIAWLVVLGIVILIVVSILTKKASPPPPTAVFAVTDNLSDEACTQLGDYCIRVHCTYQNNGDGPGEKRVGAQLLDENKVVAERQSSLTLLPGKSQRLNFDFPEAELGDQHHYTYKCMISED
jgi:hypothetical protein